MSPSKSDISREAAKRILKDNLKVKAGENVVIESWTHTLPMVSVFVDEARKLGARTHVLYEDENAYWNAAERGQGKLLGSPSDPEWAALKEADVYVFFWGPEDRPRMKNYPDKFWEEARGYNMKWYKIAKESGVRGCRMEVARATDPAAKEFGVKGEDWRREILRACSVDPQLLMKNGKRVAGALGTGKRLRITHPNGTDLELGLKGFKPRVYAGTFTKENVSSAFGILLNLPAGQVAVALDENVGEGTLVGNRASYLEEGKASGARWTFSGGKLVDASFKEGEKAFLGPYRKAKGSNDSPSFMYIGINPEIHQAPNMEDTELGAVLVGVGRNTFVGGTNASDFMGWAVVAGGALSVDGKPILRSGRIL
jgi:leucyl aminopeptidase (aminopeptidase T)